MKLSTERKNAIKEFILKEIASNPNSHYGLRADDFEYAIGDICNKSHQLFQDPIYDDSGELVYPEGEGVYSGYYDAGELDGTCAVEVTEDNIDEALKIAEIYFGDYLYLIRGDSAVGGNDIFEVIICEAEVVFVC